MCGAINKISITPFGDQYNNCNIERITSLQSGADVVMMLVGNLNCHYNCPVNVW